MMRPRFQIKLTHIPTGIEVIRDSNHHRTQYHARESAWRYLRSRLYMINPKNEDVLTEDINEQ